jgi:hypothetical protein
MVKVYKDYLTNQLHRTFDIVDGDNQTIHSNVHFVDTTVYTQVGDKWGANDINDLNAKINSVVEDKVLASTDWVGSTAPFTYTLTVSDVTLTSNQEILPGLNITATELEALQGANLQDGGQTNGSITIKAFGEKPTINIPIRVLKRGVK